MNLNNYDNIKEKIDKTKTWIDIRKKQLFSKELKYRPYISLLKRYNPKHHAYTYFIALLDDIPVNKEYSRTICDSYGRIKINLSSIWDDTYLNTLDSACNIMCNLVECEDDGDVYSIDV